MTYSHLLEVLELVGVRRSRVTEFMMRGEIFVEVPKKQVARVTFVLEKVLPLGVVCTVKPLAWWRGWFLRHKLTTQYPAVAR